jgi:signal peptidase II
VALGVWLYKAETRVTALALGLIIGGALGNVIDRVQFGAVVDFLDFHMMGYHWPAFNVADSGICIGAAMLILESLFQPGKSS